MSEEELFQPGSKIASLNVLYIGSLQQHSNSYRRYSILQQICRNVTGLDIATYIYSGIFRPIHHRYNSGPGVYRLNMAIKHAVKNGTYDLIVVDNRPFVTEKTLRWIKLHSKAKIINILTDDPSGKYNKGWRLLRTTASYYDCYFVQRVQNIAELKDMGAPRVEVSYRSFDPLFHRPLEFTDTDKLKYACKVGFIGSYESEREEYIAWIISSGIPVQITGDGWNNGKHWNVIKDYYTGPSVYGEEYPKRINGMDIALHFLRKGNRDEQDSRTFEIPACRTFMLAERSITHQSLFVEDVEACYFDSKEELKAKIEYYLNHTDERQAIADKGYERCFSSGYDHKSRLLKVLQVAVDL